MNRPVDIKEPVARISTSSGPHESGKGEAPPLYDRLRSGLRRADLSRGDNKSGAAPVLAALAELIDADAAALVVEQNGTLVVSDLTIDARHRDIRTKLASELRMAASEALRGSGTRAEPSSALPGLLVIASGFEDRKGAVAALKAGNKAEMAKARATLELACRVLNPAARSDDDGLPGALSTLVLRLRGTKPADPVELAALFASAFETRQVIIAASNGKVAGMAPSGPARRDSVGEQAVRDLVARSNGADGPILERGQEVGSLTAILKADTVVALRAGDPRDTARPTCLLVDPKPAFTRLGAEDWVVVQTLLDSVSEAPGRDRARVLRRWTKNAGALVAASLVVVAMFVPIPDRIRAEAELEPEGRSFVTATFNAVLRHTSAAPGDTVARGDTLAELEGEELVLSRATAAAKAEEAFRTRDAAVRAKEVTEAELARLEGEAFASERDLLDWQISQLQLKSPIDGVVLASPFEHSDGAPVREGDIVAEVAPLDRLRVRIDVPVEDYERLASVTEGKLHLDGVSGEPVTVSGFSRAARAETIDERTVIPLRTGIDNPESALRPGQKGVVLLPTGSAMLGKILFRNAWNALERWAL